jgi:hypothetical protein
MTLQLAATGMEAIIIDTPINESPWAPVELTATGPETEAPVDDWAEREKAAAFARAWTNDERDKSSILTIDAPDEAVELSTSDEELQARELAAAWTFGEAA